MLVRPKWQEDPDQVRVTALLEDLAGKSEGRLQGVAIAVRLGVAKQARRDAGDLAAAGTDDRHLDPCRGAEDGAADHIAALRLALWLERADDHGAPRARDEDQHVIGGEGSFLLERPARDAPGGVRSGAGHRRLDGGGGGRACGEAHEHRLVGSLVEEVDSREVEIELGH